MRKKTPPGDPLVSALAVGRSRDTGPPIARIQSRLLFLLPFLGLILASRFSQQCPAISVLCYRLYVFRAHPVQEDNLISYPAAGARVTLLPAQPASLPGWNGEVHEPRTDPPRGLTWHLPFAARAFMFMVGMAQRLHKVPESSTAHRASLRKACP
jgi:hypothetical protein